MTEHDATPEVEATTPDLAVEAVAEEPAIAATAVTDGSPEVGDSRPAPRIGDTRPGGGGEQGAVVTPVGPAREDRAQRRSLPTPGQRPTTRRAPRSQPQKAPPGSAVGEVAKTAKVAVWAGT